MNRNRRIEIVSDDEISLYAHEFTLLCDRLAVCEEIREGWYSDEARVCDLFSFLDSRDEVAARVAELELPGVTPSSYLISALKVVRQLWAVN